MTPPGSRSVLNDAISIYFLDPTLARAFIARWCAGYKVETTDGVFQVRDNEPAPRVGSRMHHSVSVTDTGHEAVNFSQPVQKSQLARSRRHDPNAEERLP
jgi:hypothetical protein